jgi:hypothetical protein
MKTTNDEGWDDLVPHVIVVSPEEFDRLVQLTEQEPPAEMVEKLRNLFDKYGKEEE